LLTSGHAAEGAVAVPRGLDWGRRIGLGGQRAWHDRMVATIALFHSVYGPRPAVPAAAELLRSAGQVVVTPDLYAGEVAASIDDGFALSERVCWETIMWRAHRAVRDLPPNAVLAGLSMGSPTPTTCSRRPAWPPSGVTP
jgi:hypothetical protein